MCVALACAIAVSAARVEPGSPGPVKNACAFVVDPPPGGTAASLKASVAATPPAVAGNSTVLVEAAPDGRVVAAFAGFDAEAVADAFCASLPGGLQLDDGVSVVGKGTLGSVGPSPRSCYVYGYNLARCGGGYPRFGCSESRACYKWDRRGRCRMTRRVCKCGGSYIFGC